MVEGGGGGGNNCFLFVSGVDKDKIHRHNLQWHGIHLA